MENWCEGYLDKHGDRSLQMTKDVEILVPHVDVHQMVTSAEEEFSNQVDRMASGQHVSPAIPAIAQ